MGEVREFTIFQQCSSPRIVLINAIGLRKGLLLLRSLATPTPSPGTHRLACFPSFMLLIETYGIWDAVMACSTSAEHQCSISAGICFLQDPSLPMPLPSRLEACCREA